MDPAVCGLAEHPAAKTQLLEWVGGGNHLRFRGLRENRQRKKKPQGEKNHYTRESFQITESFQNHLITQSEKQKKLPTVTVIIEELFP